MNKDFKVIMYATAYNEAWLLSYKHEYCKRQDHELYKKLCDL